MHTEFVTGSFEGPAWWILLRQGLCIRTLDAPLRLAAPSRNGPKANLWSLVGFVFTYYTTLFSYLAPIQVLLLLSLFFPLDQPVSPSYLLPYAALTYNSKSNATIVITLTLCPHVLSDSLAPGCQCYNEGNYYTAWNRLTTSYYVIYTISCTPLRYDLMPVCDVIVDSTITSLIKSPIARSR